MLAGLALKSGVKIITRHTKPLTWYVLRSSTESPIRNDTRQLKPTIHSRNMTTSPPRALDLRQDHYSADCKHDVRCCKHFRNVLMDMDPKEYLKELYENCPLFDDLP